MATIMTKQGQLDNVVTYEHICDTVADMANINPSYVTLGSVCIVIKGESDGLEIYMANSRKEWEIVSFGAGGSGGGVEGAAIHICAQDEYDSATGIPTIQAPLSNTFYLTPGSGETNDLYNEWIWLEEEEKWEKFGSASGSGQSDWEQANTTTSDFIKNKPSIKSGTASYSILESKATKATGIASHAEGQGTHATGDNAHAEGYNSVASGQRSHAEGNETQAIGEDSHAEGGGSDAKGNASHAEGSQTVAEGYASHTEGEGTKAQEEASHAEGFGTTASGFSSHAEGNNTTASGQGSHAEGGGTQSKGDYAHAEGGGARANGANSHAEGTGTTASGNSSHAEGAGTLASGANSHTEGLQTIANHLAQHVFGMNNVPDNSTANADMKGNYVEIVGNGLTNNSLSNARTLDWEGNEEVAGDIRANACGGANPISLVEVSNNVENKLNKNQGLVNAGKMLGINSEGEVQPIQVLGGNVSVTETLESGEDYSMVIEEGEPTTVTSVAGKYGTVTLDAGDIEYDEQEVYNSGTVGKKIGDLKSQMGADVADLKSQIETKISTQQMQECDTVEVPKSPNLWNPEIAENGYLHKNGTNYTGGTYDNYCHASIGEVEQGDVLYFYYDNGSYIARSNPIFIVCYDSNGTVMPDAGTNNVNTFTVPEGVAEIKITVADSYSPVYMAIKNDDTMPSGFIPYSEAYSYYIAKKGFIHTAFVEESADIMSAGDMDEGKFLKAKTVENGKVTEWEFDEAGATGDFVEKGGTDQVTPKNLQIMEKTYSPNLIDESKLTSGYVAKNGTISASSSYQYTDYIPVEAGGKYCFSWMLNNAYRQNGTIRFFACYNANKEVIASAGSDTAIGTYPIVIAEGVAFVRLSFTSGSGYTKYQFEKGEERGEYYEYGEVLGAVVKDEYLPDVPVDIADIPAFQLVDGQNLLNQEDPDFMVGFLYTGGTVDATMTSYRTSGYIAVTPGDHLMGSYVSGGGSSGYITFRTVAAYNSGKTVINASGAYNLDSNAGYYVPSGVSFIRICYAYGSYGDNVQICKTNSNRIKPYVPYTEPHYELKGDYLAPFPSAPEHVYLPEEVYVAVGRTIEFYNEQIVLDYEKYHFQWKSAKGYADKRKFSITGASTGNVNLSLTLYDDKMNICWVGACTIHVVAASNPTVKIIPIGDSLTRGKAWLPEVMLLSSSNVEWLGTRYSNYLKDSENNTYAKVNHEGRSGWSAGNYLANSVYDQDTAYDGVPGVDGSANPFWDGSKFSLEHYLTVQTGIDMPDAVQIFLGTNDLTVSVETATQNIVAMVESIRSEYANLPIFICNTIYRSNQNGYGSVGNDAYAGAGAGANSFQYEQDSRVMDLMVGLRNALRSMTGVYLVPLASCMDREYDFGQTMTKVNPRSAVEIAMPTESVHPQAPGYYQMADLMYSTYCGVLS